MPFCRLSPIELRSGDFIRRVSLEHVVLDRRGVPVVRRPGQIRDHGRLVPLDLTDRVLVFVDEAERVAELVQDHPPRLLVRDAGIEPAEIHRRLPLRARLHVVPITDHEPRCWKEIRMSVFGPCSQLKVRLAWSSHSFAYRFTSAFWSAVPSRKDIEILAFSGHLLSLTSAALVCPVVGGAAWNHAKHHLSWFSGFPLASAMANPPNVTRSQIKKCHSPPLGLRPEGEYPVMGGRCSQVPGKNSSKKLLFFGPCNDRTR